MDWTLLVTNLGSIGIVSGAVVVLFKQLIPHLWSLNLERYKADLTAASDRDLEGYKAQK